MDTITYADGYGRWHVLTRDTPRGLTRAIDAMVSEITARESTPAETVRGYVNRNIVSAPLSDWGASAAFGGVAVPPGAWIHFAEYAID